MTEKELPKRRFALEEKDLAVEADEKRYPHGPWCKKGDWIIFGRYSGSRFGIEGGEVRILNEDEIIAVVKDPEDILQYK